MIVITADVPNAYQNWKFELLITAFRFFRSCPNDAPLKDTGLATMDAWALNEFRMTRKNGNSTYSAITIPIAVKI